MRHLLALDPGRAKTGVCLVAVATGRPSARDVVPNERRREALRLLLAGSDVEAVAVGNGTGSAEARRDAEEVLAELPPERRPALLVVPERNTTYRARFLYLEDHPPPFPLSLLPRTLIPVLAPLDGYAAQAIALDYLADRKAGNIPFNKNLGL